MNKSFVRSIFLSAVIAASSSVYSQSKSDYDSIARVAKTISYTKDFSSELGTILHAKREDGLTYLVEQSNHSKISDSWAFIPKYEFWINIARIDPQDSSVSIDNAVRNYAFNLADSIEIYHTHSVKEYHADPGFNTDYAKYGNIMYYLPSPEDNFWMLSLTYTNPRKKLLFGIASKEGVIKFRPDSLMTKYPSMNHDDMNRLSNKITVFIAEFFTQVKVDDYKIKSKAVEGVVSVDFDKYVLKN